MLNGTEIPRCRDTAEGKIHIELEQDQSGLCITFKTRPFSNLFRDLTIDVLIAEDTLQA